MFLSKSDQNIKRLAPRPIRIYVNISREKCLGKKFCKENQNTHFVPDNSFPDSRGVYEIMSKITVHLDGPQMKI